MSLSQEQAEFLLDACRLVQYATGMGFMVTGGELARTPEQQAIYVKTGRSKTLNSIHLKRCAGIRYFRWLATRQSLMSSISAWNGWTLRI